jgi:hypothetical protein
MNHKRIPFNEELWKPEPFLGAESRLDREAVILLCATWQEPERDRDRSAYMADLRKRIVTGRSAERPPVRRFRAVGEE